MFWYNKGDIIKARIANARQWGVQVKHAYRLNIIDDKKYNALSKRFNKQQEEINKNLNELQKYADEHGLIEDLGIFEVPTGTLTKKLVPALDGLVDRFELLSKDQQIEYIKAFRNPLDVSLMKKYKSIRKNSYLLSLIKHYDEFQSETIIKECQLLAKVLNDKDFLIINGSHYYLDSLSPEERERKLEKLIELDGTYFDTNQNNMSFSISFGSSPVSNFMGQLNGNQNIKRISLGEDYFHFMTTV